jgi:NhaP-type Na+/H+ or K+/H+ antiporter
VKVRFSGGMAGALKMSGVSVVRCQKSVVGGQRAGWAGSLADASGWLGGAELVLEAEVGRPISIVAVWAKNRARFSKIFSRRKWRFFLSWFL